jgi:flagellar basal-body rod modification protein FlgD
MQVPATSQTTAAAATSSSASSSTTTTPTVNYNDFLQLLITELQNQDPTSPMDPTQSISQLASFSAVQQQVQTNSTLTSMLTSSALSQAEGVIGKTVTSADGSTSGQVVSVTVTPTGATANLSSGSQVSLVNGVTIS